MAIAVGAGVSRQQRLDRVEAFGDPMIVPACKRRLVVPERAMQIAQDAQVIERMDVAGDDCRQRRAPSPVRPRLAAAAAAREMSRRDTR